MRLLLKKDGLDVSQMNSYRPVSNLPFLSTRSPTTRSHTYTVVATT